MGDVQLKPKVFELKIIFQKIKCHLNSKIFKKEIFESQLQWTSHVISVFKNYRRSPGGARKSDCSPRAGHKKFCEKAGQPVHRVMNRLGVGSEILDGDLDVFRRIRKTTEKLVFNG